jgi:hypothetical protein
MHMVPDHRHSIRVNSVCEADCCRMKIDDISVFVHSRVRRESLAGRGFCSPYVGLSTYTSRLWLVLIYFIYCLFDVDVIVSGDVAWNPVHIGTPGCRNIRSIFYHRRLDILSVLFLQVLRLKFCITYPIRATFPAYLFLIRSQPWLRNRSILDGALWYEILPFSICEVDSELFNYAVSTADFFNVEWGAIVVVSYELSRIRENIMVIWSSALTFRKRASYI